MLSGSLRAGVKIESGTRVAAAEMRAEHTFADFGPRLEGCEIIPSETTSLVGADVTTSSFEVEHGPTATAAVASFEVDNGAAPAATTTCTRGDSPNWDAADSQERQRRRMGAGGLRKLRNAANSAAAAVRAVQQRLCERKADWEGGERAEPRSPRLGVGGTLLSAERVTFEVEQMYFGMRYLRTEQPMTGNSKTAEIPLCCKGCDSLLSYTDQVLCTERRWGFRGVTAPVPSMYMNSLLPGSTKETPVTRMGLGQGVFDMCDVTCGTCERPVGYRFKGADDGCNENHVGRAGLVLRCIQLGSEHREASASAAPLAATRLPGRLCDAQATRRAPQPQPRQSWDRTWAGGHEQYRVADPHARMI